MEKFEPKPKLPTKPESSLDDVRAEILEQRLYIINFCKRLLSLGSNARYVYMAETLGNEAIIKACNKADQYQRRDTATLKTWIGTIAKNLVINFLRDIKNEPSQSDISIDEKDDRGFNKIDLKDTGSSPEEQLIKKERLGVLKEGMEILLPSQRQALELSLYGETYEEIAKQMNVSVSAVKGLIFRAREELREYAKSRERKRK